MERDVVAHRQPPGDSTNLWGAERLSKETEVASIIVAAALPAQLSRPETSTYAHSSTSSEGGINYLAPGSSSEERSHLWWTCWSSALEHIYLLLNCFLSLPLTQKAQSSAAVSIFSCP